MRLHLASTNDTSTDDVATMLTVQWPLAFSKDLRELDAVEPLVRQFLAPSVVF